MPTWNMPKEIEFLFRMWEIRRENGFEFPTDFNQFKIDCRKSALLQRMLDGKEPFPIPPPKAYSYPWYDLIIDGYGFPGEVWEASKVITGADELTLIIDQSGWKILEKLSDQDWIASYFYGKQSNVSLSRWHVYQIGSRFPQGKVSSSRDFLWKIEKINEPLV
jgi:hypothetical protein